MTRTITLHHGHEERGGDRRLVRGPQLVLALSCHEPVARPARFSLMDVDEVLVGRGPQRALSREERRLTIRVPDGFMSSSHARLVRVGSGWEAEDAGSKNGTLLGEEKLVRARLEDQSILTVGNTLFVFRADAPMPLGEQDRDLSGTPVESAAVTTLDGELAARFERLMQVAVSTLPILIRGDTGTGKELVCRAVHDRSERSGPFVAVNCGALPTSLITSELFGARKGAYSGATDNRTGLVRSADGGTLFLDEIAELPLEAQAALLRVLQEKEVLPVGADRPVSVDVRIVAATHRDLAARVSTGEFREDLYSRVAGYELTLPPLADRPQDIGLIVGTLLERAGHHGARFSPAAGRSLLTRRWPRNVRELEHALGAALTVAGRAPVSRDHLPEPARDLSPGLRSDDEASRLRDLMADHRGNVTAVARAMGTSRSQVRRIAQRLGVDPGEFRR